MGSYLPTIFLIAATCLCFWGTTNITGRGFMANALRLAFLGTGILGAILIAKQVL